MNVAMAGGPHRLRHGHQLLPTAHSGRLNAAEMMMGGRFVHADRALRIGLVSDVVPIDQLTARGEHSRAR